MQSNQQGKKVEQFGQTLDQGVQGTASGQPISKQFQSTPQQVSGQVGKSGQTGQKGEFGVYQGLGEAVVGTHSDSHSIGHQQSDQVKNQSQQ